MEQYTPGQAYGQPFTTYIWICANTNRRGFEKCNNAHAQDVLTGFQQTVQMQGLSRKVMVMTSSCLLGCLADGVTIAIAKYTDKQNGSSLLFFNNVTTKDIPDLMKLV